jgi:hypothetical protein
MTGSDEYRGRSRRHSADDQVWSSIDLVLGGRVIKRSCDTVCGLYRAYRDEEHEFFGGALKPLGRFLPVWSQNRWRQFSWFGLKTKGDCFLVWTSKPVATV